jgi:AraC-like DNA-binding protein
MSTKSLDRYHLHKEDPSARQFELFDLEEYLKQNLEHSSLPHAHSFYQLIWFESDEGKHFVDFNAHPIAAGRIFLIAKGQVHYFDRSVNYKGVLMHFNESFLMRNENDIELFIQFGLFNSLSPYVQLTSDYGAGIRAIKDEIKRELSSGEGLGHRLILSQLLRTMLILLERIKQMGAPEVVGDIQQSIYLRFRAELESKFKTDFAVTDYAALLNVSSKTLTTHCKRGSGHTPSMLIVERKTIEAKRLLLHTEAQVNEVAFALGFEDPSYFIRYFKKHVGITPMQFRKSISE